MAPRRRRPRRWQWFVLAALLAGVVVSFGVVEGDVEGCGGPMEGSTVDVLTQGTDVARQPLQTLNTAEPRPFKPQLDPSLIDPNP